jgi:hypothetical protein
MSYKKFAAIAFLILCTASISRAQKEDYGSGAIKTEYGFLHVWNEEPDNYYTLEIRGKDIKRKSAEQIMFNVDGKMLQILTIPIEKFLGDPKNIKLNERAILNAHQDWEFKYLEETYKEKLTKQSSWQKRESGGEALSWDTNVPASAKSNVTKQVFLTAVKGNYVLMLGGVVTGDVEESAARKLLTDTLATLKPSDKPIDLTKLSEAIKKGVKN